MTMQNICASEFELETPQYKSGIASVLKRIADFFETQERRRKDRQGLNKMLKIDDNLLCDIGITRADVTWANSLPSDVEATKELDRIRRYGRT